MKRVMDDAYKIAHLETTFRDRALTWYLKYKSIVPMIQVGSLMKIKRGVLRDFQKLKLESQCIVEIKEIKQQVRETIWDCDQWFEILLEKLTFQIQDVQHREWFIVGLLPHIHILLTQQKVTTQLEAVKIAMH